MKKNLLTTILTKVYEQGLWKNDGKGLVYRKDEEKGYWVPYKKGVPGRQRLESDLKNLDASLTPKEVKTVFEAVSDGVDFAEPRLADDSPSMLMACRNGIIDLSSGELVSPHDEQYIKIYVDFNYDKTAKLEVNGVWVKFLAVLLGVKEMMVPSSSKLTVLLEIIIYCLSSLPNAKKAIILLGPPNIGKSVFLNFLGRLIGSEGYTALTWQNIVEKYHEALVQGRRAILSDEMPCQPLTKLDVLKSIISGGVRVAETKFGKVEDYRATCTLISAANNLPTLGEPDAGGAFAERLLILPLGDEPAKERNPNLLDKLWEERDAFVSMAVAKAPALIKRGMTFSETDEMKELLRKFSENGNDVEAFINAKFSNDSNAKISVKAFYEKYVAYCEDELLKPVSKSTFRRNIIQLGYELKKTRPNSSSKENPVSCVIGLSEKHDPEPDKTGGEAVQ